MEAWCCDRIWLRPAAAGRVDRDTANPRRTSDGNCCRRWSRKGRFERCSRDDSSTQLSCHVHLGSTRIPRVGAGIVPYSYPPQAITSLHSRRSVACIIAMSVEPRKDRRGATLRTKLNFEQGQRKPNGFPAV